MQEDFVEFLNKMNCLKQVLFSFTAFQPHRRSEKKRLLTPTGRLLLILMPNKHRILDLLKVGQPQEKQIALCRLLLGPSMVYLNFSILCHLNFYLKAMLR